MLRTATLRPLSFALLAGVLAIASTAAAQDTERPATSGAPEQWVRPAPPPQTYRFDYRLPQPAEEPEEDNTRAVRIIDEAAFPPSTAPAPVATEPSTEAGPPPNYEMAKVELKAENSAGLSIQILPGPELQVGSRIAFKVSTKRTGYLLLVDVDASGKLTQIFPNQRSLMAERGRENANRIRAGQTVTIPEKGNAMAGFEFVAAPPNGVAMVVAIMSDRAVQLIDLPDVPPQFTGREEALKYLTDFARTLKIAGNEDGGALQDTKWSFDAKFYVIR